MTLFGALVQDYVRLKGMAGEDPGRMVALVGDAELDEGNVYEAMLEGWKHDVRNVWWVIDYNRQSLDAVVTDRLFSRIDKLFETMGWRVDHAEIRQAAAGRLRGAPAAMRCALDRRLPELALLRRCFKGGAAWREHLLADLGDEA